MRRLATSFSMIAVLGAPLAAPPAPAAAAAPAPQVIAAGVSVAGTDVGGLEIDDAADRLATLDAPILRKPVTVISAGRRFSLSVYAIGLQVDVDRSARRAYAAGLAARGRRVDIPLTTRFSRAVVAAFAARIRRAVARPARNATLHMTLRRMVRRRGHDGRDLDPARLARTIGAVVSDPRRPRTIRRDPRRVHPPVTWRGLSRAYPTVITIDRGRFTLRLFKRLRVVHSYGVAVGMPGHSTPTGLFHVTSKQVNPDWNVPNSPWAGELAGTTVRGGSAANPLKARWMGLAGGVGIHGTGEDWSIGHRASHGCIRMHVGDVIALYRRTPLGTPVLIGD